MKKIIFISIIILLIVAIVITVGYLKKRGEKKKEISVKIEEKVPSLPVPAIEEKEKIVGETETSSISETSKMESSQPFFKQKFLYLDLDYPFLYVYDPKESIIKYFNLEEETYREIYKVFDIKNAYLSQDKLKIILEKENFQFLDIKSDSLYNLPSITKNFIFTPNDLILYLNNDKEISYLAYFRQGKVIKIRDLGILNPDFEFFKNNLLIYENNSPVFLLNLSKPNILEMFLPAKENYSLLINKNQDLIFVSFKEEDNFQSEIINLKKKVLISFPWGTIKEKCSFDENLICAIPSDLKNFDPEEWKILKPNYDEKIVIYDIKNNETKEIKLEGQFDIVRPKLTPLGIVFWNRLDAKFYFIKPE